MKTQLQRWFMPWRWPRWVWIVTPLVSMAAYFLSAVPVMRIAERTGRAWNHPVWVVYKPVWVVDDKIDLFAMVISWEDRIMDRVLGERGDWVMPNRDEKQWVRYPTIVDQHRKYHRKIPPKQQ